jgi:hypothetical protein
MGRDASHCPFRRRRFELDHPERVVHLRRSVDGEADQVPIKVGSLPWNATTTSSTSSWAARSWLM